MTPIVPATEGGIRAFTNAVKRFAAKDKAFAEAVADISGPKGKVTTTIVRQSLDRDIFERSGKLSETGKKIINKAIEELKLPKNATYDDIFVARAEEMKKPVVTYVNLGKCSR